MAVPTPIELQRRANQLLTEAESALDVAEGADAAPSAEQSQRHDALVAQAENLIAQAAELETRAARRAELLAATERSGTGGTPSTDPRNTRNGRHAYDVTLALRAVARDAQLTGLEREEDQELRKFRSHTKGILIPLSAEIAYRAFTAPGGTMTTIRGPIINALMDRLVLVQAGVQYVASNGLFQVPLATAGTTSWVTNATPAAADRTLAGKPFVVNTIAGKTKIDRQTLTTANVDTQAYLWDQLTRDIGQGFQRGCLHGTGSAGQPKGFFAHIGADGVFVKTPATNGEVLDHAKLTALVGAVEQANAESPTFITNPSVTAKLETTARAGTSNGFLYDPASKQIIGRNTFVTSSVSNTLVQGSSSVCSGVLVGEMRYAVMAMFSAIDVLENPYTDDGGNTLSAFLDCDFGLLRPAAFAMAKDVLTV